MSKRSVSIRDRIAGKVCNFILNHLATPWYSNMLGGSIRYGLMAAYADHTAPTTEMDLRVALDDLWGCIGATEIGHLDEDTIVLAGENHTLLDHPEIPI